MLMDAEMVPTFIVVIDGDDDDDDDDDLHGDVQFFQYHLLKRLFFPLNCLCSFVKDQLTIFLWVCF